MGNVKHKKSKNMRFKMENYKNRKKKKSYAWKKVGKGREPIGMKTSGRTKSKMAKRGPEK